MKLSTFISLAFLASNITVAFILSWVFLWIGYLYTPVDKNCSETCSIRLDGVLNASLLTEGSSVWCQGKSLTERSCQFKQLCYHPEHNDFIFLHGPRSLVEGIDFSKRFEPAVADMSSVNNHNDRYFRFLDLPVDSLEYFTNVTLLRGNHLIFQRFFPDNIMHVFHDDLLPMYHTLHRITRGNWTENLDTKIVFMEGWPAGPYIDLYRMFSSTEPMVAADFATEDAKSLICFEDAHVGVSKTSTWYQYGFDQFQGPLENIQVTGHEIRQFTEYMRFKLNTDDFKTSDQQPSKHIVLLSRSKNRLIVNEVDLSIAIAVEFGVQVLRMSLETHSMKELVEVIGSAEAVVGMHGSILVLSMFLPPGSIIVELFPFAVNSEHYTPYQTLAKLPGMNLVYKSWQNIEVQNTVTHPDWPKEFGGIQHLTQEEQEVIQNSAEVPKHLCCKNPHWLYRIFQDTIVDIPSLLSTLHSAFKEQSMLRLDSPAQLQNQCYPGNVLNVSCQYQLNTSNVNLSTISLKLSWEPPWNLDLIGGVDIKYEVWIQPKGSDTYMAYILSLTSYTFTENLHLDTVYVVWVRCIVDGKIGPFVSSENCSD